MKAAILLALSLVATAAFGQGQPAPVPEHFQEVSKLLGKPGSVNADGSYRINIARTDVQFVSSSGMPIPADLGLSTYIAMSGTADRVLAVGDVAMLEGEIDGVIDALRAGGYEVVALHNHMTTEEPRLFYLHFQEIGKPADLARSFKSVLDVLGHGLKRGPAPKVGKPKLDAEALTGVLGVKPQTFPSGVLRFANPRKDISIGIDDQKFLPGMGLGSWAAFNACECGLTMVMGDTCCVKADLQAAIDAYRKAGIHITAIHNHVLGGSQEVEFMHFEGEGDAVKLATGIKACWNALGSK